MADKRKAAFKTWVPQAARRKISELRALPNLTEKDHHLLDRLATHTTMRTEVWKKLPPSTKGAEDFIIEWAFIGAQFAAAYRPPLPRRMKQLPKYNQKYPPILTPEDVSAYASFLLNVMKATSHQAKEGWSYLWPRDQRLTFEDVVSILEHLVTFYRRLDEKQKEFLARMSLPNIRKKNSRNAPELLFTRLLTDHFQRRFGRALDPIVDALSSVVLGRDAGVETIRGRRRSAPGAAHSGKKSK
jgi:hypothetical protein